MIGVIFICGRELYCHSACHSFPVTHKDGIGFCQKEMPEPYTEDIALCFVIDAVNDNNNALALFMLLI